LASQTRSRVIDLSLRSGGGHARLLWPLLRSFLLRVGGGGSSLAPRWATVAIDSFPPGRTAFFLLHTTGGTQQGAPAGRPSWVKAHLPGRTYLRKGPARKLRLDTPQDARTGFARPPRVATTRNAANPSPHGEGVGWSALLGVGVIYTLLALSRDFARRLRKPMYSRAFSGSSCIS